MNSILIGLLIFIVSFAVGSGVCYLYLRKKLHIQQEYNEYVAEQNKSLAAENCSLLCGRDELKAEISVLETRRTDMLEAIKDCNVMLDSAEKQAKNAADVFYTQNLELAQERLTQSLEKEAELYRQSIAEFQEEMNQIKEASALALQQNLLKKQEAIQQAEQVLNEMKAKVSAAVEASKRAEELLTEQNFYRIQLSEIDIDEIEKLRSVEPYLRDKEPLNKIIWKVYYEKPTNDLIGRVIGSGSHTGIYKITHIDSQKCYVGQAANLADRWKQHIKRGVGADTPTRNKLYPAMRESGPENFTFEVIEECDRSLLDSREDYWQDYFKAKEFGYSIK